MRMYWSRPSLIPLADLPCFTGVGTRVLPPAGAAPGPVRQPGRGKIQAAWLVPNFSRTAAMAGWKSMRRVLRNLIEGSQPSLSAW